MVDGLPRAFRYQPAANQAKWSSHKNVRGGVVIRDFLGILGTDLDERPPKHAEEYGGSIGPF